MPTQTPHPYNVSTNICHVTLFIDRNNSIIDEEYDGSTLQVIIRSIPQICSNNFTLRVQGVLKRVIITNSITNCSGVYISWERPQSVPCVQILHYTISVPELDYTYNTTDEHIIIHSDILLVSDTQYTVNIRAVNEVGYSNDSTTIIDWSNSTCSITQFSSIIHGTSPVTSLPNLYTSQMMSTSTSHDITPRPTNSYPSPSDSQSPSIDKTNVANIIMGTIIGVMGLVIIILVAVIINLIRKNTKLKKTHSNLNQDNTELIGMIHQPPSQDNTTQDTTSFSTNTQLPPTVDYKPSSTNMSQSDIPSSDMPETYSRDNVSEQNSLEKVTGDLQLDTELPKYLPTIRIVSPDQSDNPDDLSVHSSADVSGISPHDDVSRSQQSSLQLNEATNNAQASDDNVHKQPSKIFLVLSDKKNISPSSLSDNLKKAISQTSLNILNKLPSTRSSGSYSPISSNEEDDDDDLED
jgi:hypothetical protein